jgi:hypothetical protein
MVVGERRCDSGRHSRNAQPAARRGGGPSGCLCNWKGSRSRLVIYTLEALVDADKQFSATTIFEVLSSPTPDPKETGIKGLVLRASSGPVATTAAAELPIPGAQIIVTEVVNDQPTLRAPFFWQGVTNGDGRFQVNAPPGRYRVKATLPPAVGVAGLVPVEPSAVVSRTIEVTVEAGK